MIWAPRSLFPTAWLANNGATAPRINDRIDYVEHLDSPLGGVTWWGELRIPSSCSTAMISPTYDGDKDNAGPSRQQILINGGNVQVHK